MLCGGSRLQPLTSSWASHVTSCTFVFLSVSWGLNRVNLIELWGFIGLIIQTVSAEQQAHGKQLCAVCCHQLMVPSSTDRLGPKRESPQAVPSLRVWLVSREGGGLVCLFLCDPGTQRPHPRHWDSLGQYGNRWTPTVPVCSSQTGWRNFLRSQVTLSSQRFLAGHLRCLHAFHQQIFSTQDAIKKWDSGSWSSYLCVYVLYIRRYDDCRVWCVDMCLYEHTQQFPSDL